MELSDKVKLTRVTDTLSPYLLKVQSTYTSAFPETERRDFNLFCELLEKQPVFNLFVILKEDKYVGFITYWQFNQFVYVEHFAIDETSRGGGIGSIVMKAALEQMDYNVVLEVEDPVDDLTQRRVRFYEALGFNLYGADYKQPPYRENDSWYDMKLMSYGNIVMEKEYESVRDCIYTYVYNVKKPD